MQMFLLLFSERYAEGFCVRNGAMLSGWIVNNQSFKEIDGATFSERIVTQR